MIRVRMMKRLWLRLATGAIVYLVLAGALPADAADQSTRRTIDAMRERVNAGTVGIVSGGINGTYIRIAAELASVLDNGDTLRILPLVGKGSVQNIADILFLKGIDIGIVQSDVLAYIKRERIYPGADKSIQYIAKLYNEEVHLLVGKGIAGIAELAGKKVNFDVANSGTAMTASLIFDRLKTPVEPVYSDQALALDKLRRGEIAALVYVAGKPAPLFRDAKAEDGLHLLPLPLDTALLETYLPSQISHADYPVLIPEGETVDTVAVGAVMAVYNWAPGSDRYRKVARFVDAFFEQFPALLEPSRHPKWKEVNLAAQVPDWTRFAPAENWLKRSLVASDGSSPLQRDFTTFLDQSGRAGSTGSAADREALFQEFVRWQQNHQRLRQ
jgi:TRAP transporter TAXI family solute receptor